MSIPDVEILRNYVLTMDCGHRRRTSAPCEVGAPLPCLDDSHRMESRAVARITDVRSGLDVDRVGWLSPQAALLGAHDGLRAEAGALPWWRWRARRRLREDARAAALAGAMIGRPAP